MERFQLKLLVKMAELDQKLSEQLGIALAANPAVWWYFLHKCPECSTIVEGLVQKYLREVNAQVFRGKQFLI